MSLSERRTSLRLSIETMNEIERHCQQDGGRIPKSNWIAQAIEEKLEREKAQILNSSERSAVKGPTFYEFFAGGGMARAGLGEDWTCLFANDFDPMKSRSYRENWYGGRDLLVKDINQISTSELPSEADLVWASFPCQDLSLAGNYTGLGHWQDKDQTRSGTFWPFWNLMRGLIAENRAPKLIVLENVYGVLTSNEGKDFSAIGSAFSDSGYRFGAMVIDARHFLPHSRPRVFVVGIRHDLPLPEPLMSDGPLEQWHPKGLLTAYYGLTKSAKHDWIWWNLPSPPHRKATFTDLIEDEPTGVRWDPPQKTAELIAMMSDINKEKLRRAKESGARIVGGVYKRTRKDNDGKKIQRAEVRFDEIAGCLRTPSGGSSRQSILLVEGDSVRSRLLSPREAARLMGLPDSYILPNNYNAAYQIAGDGVAVPVVRHLAQFILAPALAQRAKLPTNEFRAA